MTKDWLVTARNTKLRCVITLEIGCGIGGKAEAMDYAKGVLAAFTRPEFLFHRDWVFTARRAK